MRETDIAYVNKSIMRVLVALESWTGEDISDLHTKLKELNY